MPLLSDQSDLFHKVRTISNACRSLARCLSTPVVAGKQTLQKIPRLAGKHVFRGLNRRPLMQNDLETHRRLEACFAGRVDNAVQSSIAEITALEAPPGKLPLTLAFSKVRPLKWTPSAPENVSTAAPDVAAQSINRRTLFKQGARWHCRTVSARLAPSRTRRLQRHPVLVALLMHSDLPDDSKVYKCAHCDVAAF